ncbi:MAG TPA: glycoside-pentoside-hexuronide (GPH):cation symporter [Clostridia bacterium]|jgi:GPH family glycoside/pentoside/hexuronide:cation symporter/probable glucitol transport protein GutA|nr:glycoside-pentoside-hexuronide (GPH):cation symporter [Clostridia bacterium]
MGNDEIQNLVQDIQGETIALEVEEPEYEKVKLGERLSYAFTNTGQTMIYGLFGFLLMLFMTDYLYINAAVAGLMISLTRIYDAINDPIMGQIVDKTKTKWGKCRPYMLFTPIPVAIFAMLIFMPTGLRGGPATAYITVMYILFTMVYTANDIPYWGMSAVITRDPKQRTEIVTLTRLIGGLGSALSVGGFWFVNSLFAKSMDKHFSLFCSVSVYCILGAAVMLQGFFFTKERAVDLNQEKVSFFSNLKLVPKAKPLVINIIAGALFSVVAVGSTALTSYFVKWNISKLFPTMESNNVMAIFTPVTGFLPAIASVIGLLIAPVLIKKFEKRTILISFLSFGVVVNIISYFVGWHNFIVFLILRFFAFLPLGVFSAITTLFIGDSVDYIEYKTGRRIEGTCFSILTFMGKFQNSISVAIIGFILNIVGYNGELDPQITNQSDKTLEGIFFMVTIVSAIGMVLTIIPLIFYDLDSKTHRMMYTENMRRREKIAKESEVMSPDESVTESSV